MYTGGWAGSRGEQNRVAKLPPSPYPLLSQLAKVSQKYALSLSLNGAACIAPCM